MPLKMTERTVENLTQQLRALLMSVSKYPDIRVDVVYRYRVKNKTGETTEYEMDTVTLELNREIDRSEENTDKTDDESPMEFICAVKCPVESPSDE